jgi:hypothetical protein
MRKVHDTSVQMKLARLLVGGSLSVGAVVLTPLVAAADTVQATNIDIVSYAGNAGSYAPDGSNANGYFSCTPAAGNYGGFEESFGDVGGLAGDNSFAQTNVGNDTGVMSFSFDFPTPVSTGSLTITAPLPPEPADIKAVAPNFYGTKFPLNAHETYTGQQALDVYAHNHGPATPCALGPANHNPTYQLDRYAIFYETGSGATLQKWYQNVPPIINPNAPNQVSFNLNLSGNTISHLGVLIAGVTNPPEGTYPGVDYSVLVNAPGYSTVPAPSRTTSLTFVNSTPDASKSLFESSLTNTPPSIAATNIPSQGAQLTATILDSFYNPVAGQSVFIGVQSQPNGGAFTAPVTAGSTGNGEPQTGPDGKVSYYAWGQIATSPGSPDTFFAQDTSTPPFYVASSDTNPIPVNITAGVPSPPSAPGSNSLITVDATNGVPGSNPQSVSLSVDDTAYIRMNLSDQFSNAEINKAIEISPLESGATSGSGSTTPNYKGITITPGIPPGTSGTSCDQGPASEIPGISCTDANGYTYFIVHDTRTQTVSFSIVDLTDGFTMPTTEQSPTDVPNIPVLTFTPGATALSTSTVNVNGGSSANVLANGTAAATITVTLRDDRGNPEPGKAVSISPDHANDSNVTALSATTNANGNATFSVSDHTIETVIYTATDVTDSSLVLSNANQLVTVHFIAGAVSTAESLVAVAPPTVVGDGQGVSVVTVTVRDAGDHVLAGEVVALDSTSYPAITVVPPSGISDSNGVVVFHVRSTTVGSVSLPVDVGALTPVVLNQNADIDFAPVPKFTSVVAVATGPTHNSLPEATGSTDVNVTATLSDSSHVAISGLSVMLVTGTATSGPVVTTNGSGQAVFAVGLAAGAPNLVVTYAAIDVSDNNRLIGTVTVTYTPIPDEAHESTVTSNKAAAYTFDPAQLAGPQTALITVHLVDAAGNNIVGNNVQINANSAFATITALSTQDGVTPGVTDATGHAQFSVTDCNPNPAVPLCTPEVVTLNAVDTTAPSTLVQSVQVSFVLRPDEAMTSTIVATPGTVEANGTATAVVVVTLHNNGVLLSGNVVSLSQGTGHGAITTADPVSNANGQVTFTVTNLTAESVALQATDLTTATELTHDAVVTFTAPPGGSLRPIITSISPSSGPGTGSTQVTVTGSNLEGATAVNFGTVQSPTYSINASGTSLVALSAIPIAPGAVNVTVTGPGGTSAVTPADIFTYTSAPALAIVAVSPSSGALSAHTQVTIRGTGLAGAVSVHFGATLANFSLTNGGQTLSATAPVSLTAGAVAVLVTTAKGTSATSPATMFNFVGPPPVAKFVASISSLSPKSGPLAGGTVVTVHGVHFTSLTRVLFGTLHARIISINSSATVLKVSSPRVQHAAVLNVRVVNANGTSALTSFDRFSYISSKLTRTSRLRRGSFTKIVS